MCLPLFLTRCPPLSSSLCLPLTTLPGVRLALPRRIDWNVLLDSNGGPNHLGNMCDAPLIADADLGVVYRHPQYFYLGHFSKFIPRGSRRIGLARLDANGDPLKDLDQDGSSTEGVYDLSGAVAYGKCPSQGPPEAVAVSRPDGAIVIVVLNCADDDVAVQVEILDHDGNPSVLQQRDVMAHSIQSYVVRGI